ncbi:uncharacterized protein zgc:193811 isoform X1 [Electrophorus electricus]|uniref:Uncharacterized protein n=1 Tax=Electrophorus electricus TaxID=8005 RepID=A0A4W4DS73_ELEEL|nr:uncharacterized protein zgc:193811 isoform X1 [Electrophorus electricus]
MDRLCKNRQILCETSTDVRHAYTPALRFHTNSSKNTLLPPLPKQKVRGPGTRRYTSTSSSEHDCKRTNGQLSGVVYSKASPHWQTNFLKELVQKLQDHKSVRVVSAPISEMQDHYKVQSQPHEPLVGHYKTLLALYGQLAVPPALALLPKEPMLSTAQSDYRNFCRSELSPPSALDVPPIQGTLTMSGALSRLPTHKAPPIVATQLQLPRPSVPLTHGGRTSQYMDSFTVPNPPPTFSTAAPAPAPDWEKGREAGGKGLQQHILEVPKMYVTENQSYGNKRMVLV